MQISFLLPAEAKHPEGVCNLDGGVVIYPHTFNPITLGVVWPGRQTMPEAAIRRAVIINVCNR